MTTFFGVLPVAAIGNDGSGNIRAPAYFSNVLSVGAVDFSLDIAAFSSNGISPAGELQPDIYGFGVDILSSTQRDRDGTSYYHLKSGTSMSSPYVAAIAALIAAAASGELYGEDLGRYLVENSLSGPGVRVARFVPVAWVCTPKLARNMMKNGIKEYVVTVDPPALERLVGQSRASRYQTLRDNTREHKEALEAWIAGNDLIRDEVVEVVDSNALNVLFVICSPQAAKSLKNAPGVVHVKPNWDIRVDLL